MDSSENRSRSEARLFEGILEEEVIYAAAWPIDELVLHHMPHHHAFNVEWQNLVEFPRLKISDAFVFRVISKKTDEMGDRGRWNDTYVCEILHVGD